MLRHRLGAWLALTVLLASVGCSDANILGPGNALEVANNPGTFEWQATALDKITQTVSYQWVSTGTTANVNQSSSITSGTATVRITDDTGAEVYSRSLRENGTDQTSVGVAGTWTITVSMNEASGGALNFRVENP
jgi:hypothetical protein